MKKDEIIRAIEFEHEKGKYKETIRAVLEIDAKIILENHVLKSSESVRSTVRNMLTSSILHHLHGDISDQLHSLLKSIMDYNLKGSVRDNVYSLVLDFVNNFDKEYLM